MPAFYRTYRPSTFAEIIGQEHVVRTLENALKLDKLSHAYLFTGPRGTGKTTLARLLAKAANCTARKGFEPCGKCENCVLIQDGRSLDLIEFDAATHTQVDKMREVLEGVPVPPASGRYKIYIIDEAHMLSAGAWNAFLKTLEEPPAHAIFILATTALHKVPETIVSRCQRFDLSRFPVEKIMEKLSRIAKSEKLKIEPEALRLIALSAEGGMRDAESLLTQVATLQESPITEEDAAAILGITSHEKLDRFATLLLSGDLPAALTFIRELSERGENFSAFVPSFLRYLRVLLLASIDREAAEADLASFTKEQSASLLSLAGSETPGSIVSIIELFQVAENQMKNSSIPELSLEIATVKAMTGGAEGTRTDREKRGVIPGGGRKKEEEEEEEEEEIHEKSRGEKDAEQEETPGEDEKGPDAEDTQNDEVREEKPLKEDGSENAAFSFEDVRDRWRDIIREATKLNASLTLALTNARPISAKGGIITIGVRFPFHKERLAEPKAQLTLTQAFDTILSAKTRLAIVIADQEAPTKNPIVSQALAAFGGNVV